MEQISYFGQPSSYFSYITKIQEILGKFDFPTERITCTYDDNFDVGTEQYMIEGDGLTFNLTITPEGRIYCEFDGRNEYIGSVDDKPEETSHYIDVILNGPSEDLRTLFEGLLREDKQTDLYDEFKTLDIDWGNNVENPRTEELKKEVFDSLWSRDESPTKKYLPWVLAQGKEIKGLDWVQFLNSMAQVSDMMSFIDKRVSKKDTEEFANRLKRGDLENFALSYDKIVKSPKDINVYPTIMSMREFYEQIKRRTYTTDEVKKAKNESKKLYEDQKYLIVQPMTHQASCVYGAETKWCVASRDSSKYFDDYTKNSKFVYVINKKGGSLRNSKFALRIHETGKPEVWDQQDNRSNFDVLYASMPGIDEILSNILNIGGTDYQTLMKYKKSGNQDTTLNVSDYDETFNIDNGNVMLFFDPADYFKLFKHQLYDFSITQLESFAGSSYGRQTEWTDSYTAEEDWKEGYVLQSLNEDNLEKLDKIIGIVAPQLSQQKGELMKDYRGNYYSKCSEVLNAHNWFVEKMTDEYQYATDDAYTVGIEKGIDDEYCDVLQPLGIEFKVCFRKYYTSVDNMLSLYEKYGSPQKSIRAVITAAIDSEISVTDIFENFYEYKDDDTFSSRFNYESEKLLDELYENLVDEEDGVFDDIQEYQKIVDYVVNKIGFNVKKDIPTLTDTQITIVGVEPDNSITVVIQKNIGYSSKAKKYTLTFEQLISLLKNYQLFEI
jgi:hypothetical protein